jgi:hypothetical protein
MELVTVVQAEHYDGTESALMLDPIVRALAAEVPAGFDTSSWSFTVGALDEYKRRGGTIPCHIGGVAAAIRALNDA